MPKPPLHAFPVLLAGGSGTRLWPVSRKLYPKQLARFFGGASLIQNTIQRLFPVFHPEHIRVVCGEAHAHEIARDMDAIGISSEGKLIHEPRGRNTAPAILLALLKIMAARHDAILFVFPADHVIADVPTFHDRIYSAAELAEAGHIVTFGITPEYPETGYGYIEAEAKRVGDAFAIRRFVEKPDPETARRYLRAGGFYWNSGMFAFKASVMRSEFDRLKPEMADRMTQLTKNPGPIDPDGYAQLESISIDYAVMEKTERGVVLPSNLGWSDIGSWKSLYDFLPKDDNGNAVAAGDVMLQNTTGSFVMGHDRLIALNHLENVVVVETPDSVFVSDLENSRDVKGIVETLKSHDRIEYREHTTVYHAWGHVRTLDGRGGQAVRRLVIYPGAELPPAEAAGVTRHWVVTDGAGEAEVDGRLHAVEAGTSVRVGPAEVGRLANPGSVDLRVVEVVGPEIGGKD